MEKNKMMLIIIIVLLLMLMGTIIGAAVVLMNTLNNPVEPGADRAPVALSIEQIETFALQGGETFATNLAPDGTGIVRNIRLSVAIGINRTDENAAAELVQTLYNSEPILQDAVLNVVRSITFGELRAQPDGGQHLLRRTLLERFSELIGSNLIIDVYIPSLVTQ